MVTALDSTGQFKESPSNFLHAKQDTLADFFLPEKCNRENDHIRESRNARLPFIDHSPATSRKPTYPNLH